MENVERQQGAQAGRKIAGKHIRDDEMFERENKSFFLVINFARMVWELT